MTLKTGIWKANINGSEMDLSINAVGDDGRLTGSIFGDPISGFWDEVAQAISFSTATRDPNGPGERAEIQVRLYRAYRFSTPTFEPGQDVVWTLAGYCEGNAVNLDMNMTKSTARRNVFGWFAQIKEVV